MQVDEGFPTATRRIRRKRFRHETGLRPALECLEARALLASVIANVASFASAPNLATIQLGDTIHLMSSRSDHGPASGTGGPGPNVAPTITAEHVDLTYLRHNKKGKPIGKPVVSFVFDYSLSTPMNSATADDAENYQVYWSSTKKIKKKTTTLLHPVGFTTTFDASTNSVTLTTEVTQKTFAQGGMIKIIAAPPNGLKGAAGVFLAKPIQFTVLAKASGIVPES
jgi:hypothetical protein